MTIAPYLLVLMLGYKGANVTQRCIGLVEQELNTVVLGGLHQLQILVHVVGFESSNTCSLLPISLTLSLTNEGFQVGFHSLQRGEGQGKRSERCGLQGADGGDCNLCGTLCNQACVSMEAKELSTVCLNGFQERLFVQHNTV